MIDDDFIVLQMMEQSLPRVGSHKFRHSLRLDIFY